MDIRRMLIGGAIAAAVMIGFSGSAVAQDDNAKKAAPAAQAATASSAAQYKIGIVDRRSVVKGYNKITAERDKLTADVEKENEENERLMAELEKLKEEYNKVKDTLSTEEREDRELALNKKLMEYQSRFESKQAEVTDRENRLLKRCVSDIDEAVQKIGDAENYHLIIDGSKGSSTLFFAPALDISQKVIDHLNATTK